LDQRSDHDLVDTHFFEKRKRDTNTKELAKMLDGEFAECLEDGILEFLGILLRIVSAVRKDDGGEIGVVDRIVNRDRDLVLGVVVDH
jgi:predicted house-cleaning noncanonical NTP pyrophosphatase (MazG superfamily)